MNSSSALFGGLIRLNLTLSQTRPHSHILRLQPSLRPLQHNIQYTIKDKDLFYMTHHQGIASLHFTHRLKHPGTYRIAIHGEPKRYSSDVIQYHLEIPTDITVELNVEE